MRVQLDEGHPAEVDTASQEEDLVPIACHDSPQQSRLADTHPLDFPLTLCSEKVMLLSLTVHPAAAHALRRSSSDVH